MFLIYFKENNTFIVFIITTVKVVQDSRLSTPALLYYNKFDFQFVTWYQYVWRGFFVVLTRRCTPRTKNPICFIFFASSVRVLRDSSGSGPSGVERCQESRRMVFCLWTPGVPLLTLMLHRAFGKTCINKASLNCVYSNPIYSIILFPYNEENEVWKLYEILTSFHWSSNLCVVDCLSSRPWNMGKRKKALTEVAMWKWHTFATDQSFLEFFGWYIYITLLREI